MAGKGNDGGNGRHKRLAGKVGFHVGGAVGHEGPLGNFIEQAVREVQKGLTAQPGFHRLPKVCHEVVSESVLVKQSPANYHP